MFQLRPLAAFILFTFTPAIPNLQAEELPRAKAIEEDAVRALIGKNSIITGTVTTAFESPKGMTFLNLEGGRFTVIAWKDSYEKFEGGSPAKLYQGKTVEITGKVVSYRPKNASPRDPAKLEIKLTSPDQITILSGSAAKPEADDKKDGPAQPEKPSPEKPPAADPKTPKTPAKDPPKESPAPPPADKNTPVDPRKYFK